MNKEKTKKLLNKYINAKLYMIILVGLIVWQIAEKDSFMVVALMIILYLFYFIKEKLRKQMVEV